MSQIGEKVVRGFRLLAAGRFAGQLVTWIATIYVIRILSPEDYGLMAMATVVIGFLALFDELGMGAALIQQESFDDQQVRRVFGVVLLINSAALVLVVSTAGLLAEFFDEPRLVPVVWALSLQFPMLALQVIPDAIIRRRMEFRGKSITNFLAMVAGSAVTLVMALMGHGVWALVIGNIATVAARTVGYQIVASYFCLPSFNLRGLRHVVTFGGQVTLERVLWFIYTQADIFLVGRVLGKELLGYYSVAIHLASLPMTKMGSLVNEISFSGFSRIQSQRSEVEEKILKATSMVSFFAFPVFFGISAVAPEITLIILGSKWGSVAVPLQILSLVLPLRMLDLIIPTALMGTGHAKVSVGNAAIAAVLMPVSFAVGLQWGLLGVSIAWLFAYSVYYLISLARSLPVLGVRYGDYFRSMIGHAAGATFMLLTVSLVRGQLPPSLSGSVIALLTLMVTGVISFGIPTMLFHRQSLQAALRLLR